MVAADDKLIWGPSGNNLYNLAGSFSCRLCCEFLTDPLGGVCALLAPRRRPKLHRHIHTCYFLAAPWQRKRVGTCAITAGGWRGVPPGVNPGGSFCRNISQLPTRDANLVTTQTWGVIQRYVYSPYGNIQILNSDWSATPTGTQPISDYLYQGMTLDQVTGLYYARNRNYSPSLGVWISQDPLQYVNGANTYQMEMSGPVGSVDPEGMRRISFAFDAFINGNLRHHWFQGPWPYNHWQFRTDWRGFGQFNPHGGPAGDGNARLYSYGWIDSCDIGHLARGDYFADSNDGQTAKRPMSNHGNVTVGRAVPHSYFSHLDWQRWSLTSLMPGPTWDSVPYEVENVSNSESRILFDVYASDPLVLYGPPIEYKIQFDFKRINPTSVDVMLSGERTPFPDFEGYIDGNMVYHKESAYQVPWLNNLGWWPSWVQIEPVGAGVEG